MRHISPKSSAAKEWVTCICFMVKIAYIYANFELFQPYGHLAIQRPLRLPLVLSQAGLNHCIIRPFPVILWEGSAARRDVRSHTTQPRVVTSPPSDWGKSGNTCMITDTTYSTSFSSKWIQKVGKYSEILKTHYTCVYIDVMRVKLPSPLCTVYFFSLSLRTVCGLIFWPCVLLSVFITTKQYVLSFPFLYRI